MFTSYQVRPLVLKVWPQSSCISHRLGLRSNPNPQAPPGANEAEIGHGNQEPGFLPAVQVIVMHAKV